MQYETLNDASTVRSELAEGPVEVWYMKPFFFSEGISGGLPNRSGPSGLVVTHVQLGSVEDHPLDSLWTSLQGENWSPRGEANSLIRKMGLQHTSMSVGDCFVKDGKVFVCSMMGFEEMPVSGGT
jgi:hypothetical protein